MTAPRKPTSREELANVEDALVDAILNATAAELREDIENAGGDPDRPITDVDSTIARARAACARQTLERARSELAAWKAKNERPTGLDRDAARARFEKMRNGDPELASKMMMAARKGGHGGLSEKDMEGVFDDLAELERLEREDGGG
jgi:hypothetical protein